MPKRNTSITDFLLCMMCVCVHSGVCELGGHVPAIAHVWKPEKDLSCQLYFGPSPLFFHCAHQLACVWRFLCLSLPSMVLEDAAIADSSTSRYMIWILRIWIQDLHGKALLPPEPSPQKSPLMTTFPLIQATMYVGRLHMESIKVSYSWGTASFLICEHEHNWPRVVILEYTSNFSVQSWLYGKGFVLASF